VRVRVEYLSLATLRRRTPLTLQQPSLLKESQLAN